MPAILEGGLWSNMKLTLKKIAEYCGGRLFGDGSIEITGFFTDSRKVDPNKMFIPLRGERVDSHRFIPEIAERGCKATFSQVTVDAPVSYILVSDPVAALQMVAEKYRESIRIPVVGITGSVGKTTTKEMISIALESGFKVHKTAGNANSQIGLPQTILGIEPDDGIAVVEMGMSMPGEMGRIAKVAKPTMAVITNIGVSHIEFHGTKEKIMEEKLHIVDYLPPEGILFVNGDDELLKEINGNTGHKLITFGIGAECDCRAEDIKIEGGKTLFTYCRGERRLPAMVPALGDHNVRNALAAFAVSEETGLKIEDVIEAVKKYSAPEMRQQIKVMQRVTIIDDSYNASPDSMTGAIDILCNYPGRHIAVLGDMLELGEYSKKGHIDVGAYAGEKGVDVLIGIGRQSAFIVDGFADPKRAKHFDSNEEALAYLHKILSPFDVVLVKGSRGMHTDLVVKSVEKRLEENPMLSPDDLTYLKKIVGYYRAVTKAKNVLIEALRGKDDHMPDLRTLK